MWPAGEEIRSVRTPSLVHPDALEGGWVVRAIPQPFRFKLECANVYACNLERWKHVSQLHCLSLIRGPSGPVDLNIKAVIRYCPMNMSQRADEHLGNRI